MYSAADIGSVTGLIFWELCIQSQIDDHNEYEKNFTKNWYNSSLAYGDYSSSLYCGLPRVRLQPLDGVLRIDTILRERKNKPN